MTEKEKGPLPPYASPVTFNTFLGKLGTTPPQALDRSVWGKWMSGASAMQVIAAMKYLSLLDGQGHPTETLRRLLKAESHDKAELLRASVEGAYTWLFDGSIDLATATPLQLANKFREKGAEGSVLSKCLRFFTRIAQDTGIGLSDYILKASKGGVPQGTPRKPVEKRRKTRVGQGGAKGAEGLTNSSPPSLEDKILRMMPEFDPTWPPEAQAAWMDRIGELYQMMRKEHATATDAGSEGGEAQEAE